jgi:hypothetical protein
MGIKMIRFLCINYRSSEIWVDEDGHYYETDELIEFLMPAHKENFEYRTIWYEDVRLIGSDKLYEFVRDNYNVDEFDDLFNEAWNFEC